MKHTVKKMMPYALFLIIIYYGLPMLITDTGRGMIILLAAIPLLSLACAITYGIREGFHLFYAGLSAILFIPSIFFYYNMSAWIYILFYGAIALAGNGIGRIFYLQR